jgi:D-tyrosyl-tRNA(Tyr) deacylase
MKVVLQRVSHASCTVEGTIAGQIEKGLCLLVGFETEDTVEIAEKMAKKVSACRIFEDGQGKMNLSVIDISGACLSISQFTLYANCKKGNRPSFIEAARPEQADRLYQYFNAKLSEYVPVQTGIFGADMKIELCNDGPVTIIMDSEEMNL